MNKNQIMKRALACLMVVLMTVTAVPLSSFVGLELPEWSALFATKASAATEGYLRYEVEDGEAIITYCDTSISGALVIPDTLGGYPVTTIGYYADCGAFQGCIGLTSITIPNSVTNIDSFAFSDCTGLTRITIPNSVTSIEHCAFENTAWYNAQPDGDVYAGKVYYKYKGEMPQNTTIAIKDGTKGIAAYAFEGCSDLTSIKIPNSVTNIGYSAFEDCTGLTSIMIPNSVTSIGSSAFYCCTGLTGITIPDSVTSIGNDAFFNTAWYKAQPDGDVYAGRVYYKYKGEIPNNTTITIKDGTKGIAGYAFADCTGLTSIKIPNSVTNIGYDAFEGCTGLTSIKIPNSVTSIDAYAFYQCSGLTSVTMPNSITNIGDYVFYGCTRLTSITIPDSVTSIGSSAFNKCTRLTSIKIPNSVTSIGSYAFHGCTGLTSITIPDSVTSIDYSAFGDCTGLTSVNISDLVSWCKIEFNYYGFESNPLCYAKKLYINGNLATEITIPDSVTSIGVCAFRGCSSLTSVTIPNSVTSIGDSAFYDCTGLTSVTIPDSVTSIGDAFDNTAWYKAQPDGDVYAGRVYYKYKGEMPNNTTITIKDGTKGIAGYAFADCTGLTSIKIPNSVTNIGDSAFSDCIGLTSITIPNSVTRIDWGAFYDCTGLTSVTIGNGVETISSDTFSFCPLTTIKIGKNVKTIENYAFSGIKDIPEVYYAGSKADWEKISIHKSNEMLLKANMHYAISEHTHSYTSKITKAATCTEKGVKTYTCSCGNSYTEAVAATNHKNAVDKVAVAATCTAKGYTAGKYCPDCKTWISGHKEVAATGKHTYKTTTTAKATTAKDGTKVTACTVCGTVSKTTPVYKASSIKLSATKYTYNGKVQTPTVTVKDSKGNTLKNGTDYTVKYDSGRKNIGKYSVTVTFKGDYTGSKKLSFNIILGKTAKLTATQTTSSIKATWKAVTGADGYKVTLYSAKNKAIKTVYTTKTTASFTKLSKGTTYKVRVTAYKTVDGKKASSSVYTQLTTATKPGTPTLKVTAGSKKAALSWNKQTGATGYAVYMATSKNGKYTKIATVKGNGKVTYTKTGLTKGKTYYFKVAAYETVGEKTVYGSYSSVKYAKIK